jgi:hypothetical protein
LLHFNLVTMSDNYSGGGAPMTTVAAAQQQPPYHWSFDTNEKAAPRTGCGKSSYRMTQWPPHEKWQQQWLSQQIGNGIGSSSILNTTANYLVHVCSSCGTTATCTTTSATNIVILHKFVAARRKHGYYSNHCTAPKKLSPNRPAPPPNPLLRDSGASPAPAPPPASWPTTEKSAWSSQPSQTLA